MSVNIDTVTITLGSGAKLLITQDGDVVKISADRSADFEVHTFPHSEQDDCMYFRFLRKSSGRNRFRQREG